MPTAASPPSRLRLGLRANAGQFWRLVLVNAFVGGMVGLERTVLPLLAERGLVVFSMRETPSARQRNPRVGREA